jgi:hypothetical protein
MAEQLNEGWIGWLRSQPRQKDDKASSKQGVIVCPRCKDEVPRRVRDLVQHYEAKHNGNLTGEEVRKEFPDLFLR